MSDPPDDNEEIKLPPSTAPEQISVTLRGFNTEEGAKRIGNKVAGYVRSIGSALNLERLDGITIAYDYDAALVELDQGVEGLRTLRRSNDDQLEGIGMSPSVIRDGIVKVHIVFNGAYVESIEEEVAEGDEEAAARFRAAIYLIAHECCHVQVTTEMDVAFPNTILQKKINSYEEQIFSQINAACWEEYAACRLSAPFGQGRNVYYEQGLRGVLSIARSRAAEARERFWEHRDLNRIVAELGPPMSEPLRLASYLVGHMDGSGIEDVDPETRAAIEDAGFAAAFDKLSEGLRKLWAERGEWMFAQEFDVLGDVARDLFWEEGLLIKPNSLGADISVWDPAIYDGPVL